MGMSEKLIRASDARKAILKADPKLAYCIDNVKAVDAVEVVRCKDCKYRGDYPCPMYYDECVEWDDDGYHEVEWVDHDQTVDNGFCHMGERRNDENND